MDGYRPAANRGTTFARHGLDKFTSSDRQFNNPQRKFAMRKRRQRISERAGKIKYGLAAWLLGLPLPIIILALFWGGCDF
jgi:hypothetical protein